MAIGSEYSQNKRRPVMSFDRLTLVTIRVGEGEEKREFVAHECFIARAEFFRRALNGNWSEAIERIVDMPFDDPGHFALYLGFVYTNSLPRDDEPLPEDDLEWTSRCDADYMDLARVYALAEKLQDTTTKNAIIHRMFDLSERLNGQGHCALPPGKAIQVFYESTTEHSPVRRLLPDMWSTVLKEGLFAEADDLPKPFLVQLAAVLLGQKRPKAKNAADHAGVEAYLEKERDWE